MRGHSTRKEHFPPLTANNNRQTRKTNGHGHSVCAAPSYSSGPVSTQYAVRLRGMHSRCVNGKPFIGIAAMCVGAAVAVF